MKKNIQITKDSLDCFIDFLETILDLLDFSSLQAIYCTQKETWREHPEDPVLNLSFLVLSSIYTQRLQVGYEMLSEQIKQKDGDSKRL